jgi:hypothetical protein
VISAPGATLLVAVASCWAGGAVHAEPTADEEALATVLFQDGRALMSQGRTDEACLKLQESQRLDPSGGTSLNLALCHEQQGRLARSWSEFNDAAALARRDGRRDRQLAAQDHAASLAPRLSRLTVVVPAGAEIRGLRIERDGWELGRGAWSTAMPVDGGEHVVRATAPGKRPFETTVVIGKESDRQTVVIPVLAAGVPPIPSGPPAVVSPGWPRATPVATPLIPRPAPGDGESSPGGVRRAVGWALGGAGLVQLGLGGYFGWRAFDKHCANDWCGTEDQARRAADASTVLTLTGIASAAAATYLLLTSRGTSRPSTESKLIVGIGRRGLAVRGFF